MTVTILQKEPQLKVLVLRLSTDGGRAAGREIRQLSGISRLIKV